MKHKHNRVYCYSIINFIIIVSSSCHNIVSTPAFYWCLLWLTLLPVTYNITVFIYTTWYRAMIAALRFSFLCGILCLIIKFLRRRNVFTFFADCRNAVEVCNTNFKRELIHEYFPYISYPLECSWGAERAASFFFF